MPSEDNLRGEVELTAAKFAARHIAPIAAEADHAAPRFPIEVFGQGVDAGFDAFALPEELGGHGFGMAELCALIETLARTCAGLAMVFGVHAAAVKTIAESGGENSAELVKTIRDSRRPIAVAIPEPITGGGPDAALVADKGQDNGLAVSGAAGLAFNASVVGAFVVFAKLHDGRPAALLVECNGGTSKLGPLEWTLGLRAMPMAELSLDRHAINRASIIAEGKAAIDFHRSLLRHLCVVVSAAAAGVMSEAVEKAISYAAGRRQGGKMIIDHSHIRSILGGMSAGAATSSGAVLYAASNPDNDIAVIAAKMSVTDCAVRTCTDAVQVLGGYGYMRDYGLEKAMRDAATLSLLPMSNVRAELYVAEIEKERIS